MFKRLIPLLLVTLMGGLSLPRVHAAQRMTYFSQPQAIAVFMNNIALGQDSLTIPANSEMEIGLPTQLIADTLLVQSAGQPIPTYRLRFETDRYILSIPPSDADLTVDLSYLLNGLSWRPLYNMWIAPTDTGQVGMQIDVELENTAFDLEGTALKLIAGRVDTSQVVDQTQTITTNQMIADYDRSGAELGTGPVTIQHVYEMGAISLKANETMVMNMFHGDLPARRLIIWNAKTDQKVSLIYKVQNTSSLPWPDGTVRNYQGDMFVGGDYIETTPIGGEGSVTAGGLENIRVTREQTETGQEFGFRRDTTTYDVTLKLTNFSEEAVSVEVVDYWHPDGESFSFSTEPERAPNNLLKWAVDLPAGETVTITYQYTLPY